MRLLHLSDLHLGKRLYGVSMLAEQREMLTHILSVIETEGIEAVLIAGDVYDRMLPPAEAVELCDWFLSQLAAKRIPVLLINGNHDSAERLAFGAQLMGAAGVYLTPVYDGTVRRVTLEDAEGPVDFYLLPFLKPALVRPYDPEVSDYPSALTSALRGLPTDPTRRNVLLAHQFVTGAAVSESEERIVGGLDEVPVSVFDGFDYVALGHLHQAQHIGRETVRYCGTPLQYAFSEGAKSLTIVELGAGAVEVRTLPLSPAHPLRTLRGDFHSLLNGEGSEDYLYIRLTDEQEIPDAAARLRSVYPNLLRQDYDNTRTRSQETLELEAVAEQVSPMELFTEFYRMQNGQDMTEAQSGYLSALLESMGGADA